MKFEVSQELLSVVKDILKTIDIPDTLNNREKFLTLLIQLGINGYVHGANSVRLMQENFPDAKPERIFEVAPQEEEPKETPKVCLDCERVPTYDDARNLWACNCRKYEHGPQPDTVCKRCKEKVEPFHYYWLCKCNRYDSAPEFVSSFPSQ